MSTSTCTEALVPSLHNLSLQDIEGKRSEPSYADSRICKRVLRTRTEQPCNTVCEPTALAAQELVLNDLITYTDPVKGLGLKAGRTLSEMSKALRGDQFIMIGVYTGKIEYFKRVPKSQQHALYTTPNAGYNDAITTADPNYDILSRMNEPDEQMNANVWLVHHFIDCGHDTDIWVPVFLTNNRKLKPDTVLTVHYGNKFLRGEEGTGGHYVAGQPPDCIAPDENMIKQAFKTFVTSKHLDQCSIAMSYGAICNLGSEFTTKFKEENKSLLKELKDTNNQAINQSIAKHVVDELSATTASV